MAKTTRLGQNKCPGCGKWIKGTRTRVCPKCSDEFNGKPKKARAPKPAKAVPSRGRKPTKAADAITITQVRAVAELVTTVGGFVRCHALLGVIRDVGGLKRMKDLLDALAAAHVVQSQPEPSANPTMEVCGMPRGRDRHGWYMPTVPACSIMSVPSQTHCRDRLW